VEHRERRTHYHRSGCWTRASNLTLDDGSLIATWKELGREVTLWSVNPLSLVDTLKIGKSIYSLAFSPDPLVIACLEAVKHCDLKNRAFVASATFPSASLLSFPLDCTRLAAANQRPLQPWDVQSLKALDLILRNVLRVSPH
jgi:hypothetical protein